MGLCHRLSNFRSPRRRTACLAAQIQLASPTCQPKVQTTHQSPRSNPGQPVEAPHLAFQGSPALPRSVWRLRPGSPHCPSGAILCASHDWGGGEPCLGEKYHRPRPPAFAGEPRPADLARSGGAGSRMSGHGSTCRSPCPPECREDLDDLVKQGMPGDDQSGRPPRES